MALLEAVERPVYQRIAEEASQLRRLGMNNARIAQHLQVDAKTVAKATEWLSQRDEIPFRSESAD